MMVWVAAAFLAACGNVSPLSPGDAGSADGGALPAVDGGGADFDGGALAEIDGGDIDGGLAGVDGGAPADDGGAPAGPDDLIGAGFTGGACLEDRDCAPAGSRCVTSVSGGACISSCTSLCADRATPYAPVTFCIERAVYEERLGAPLESLSDPGVCVSKCAFDAFPATGCRSGFHCERRPRASSPSVVDSVCVPGPWSIGLSLSHGGATVQGVLEGGPAAAEPYASLARTRCGGESAELPATLVAGFARFLLAAGAPAGWERLCAAPADLPDRHGTRAEAAAGQALRIRGTRQQLIEWTGLALHGTRLPRRASLRGPLWGTRVLVRADDASSSYFLYAGGTPDHPYAFDPSRARHFGAVGAHEWRSLDTALEPDREYRLVKASQLPAFTRQWALAATIDWVKNLARAYLERHGVPLGVGDLSLPTGGPISDHSSHQRGTDVDVYLLTFDRGGAAPGGAVDFSRQELWVSQCTQQADAWACGYTENASGAAEGTGAGHLPAAALLRTLAEHALETPGATWFVQNDVTVLAPLRAVRNRDPVFIDASNVSGSGWPPHLNHAHIRLAGP